MNYLPNKLTKLRKHYNLSQQYIAELLNIETIEYMAYENGSNMISYDQMKKLCGLYHIELAELFRNNEEVTLYENTNTDEINIQYFTKKKGISDTINEFVMSHKVATSIIGILLLTILVLSIFISNMSMPVNIERENRNRLSVSNTTVIYIDDNGSLAGSGSNDNGQLNNLTATSPIKVQEGEGFSVILNEDGTLTSTGLSSSLEKQVNGLKNIKDIAAGSSHILAVDATGKVTCISEEETTACEIDGTRNINKVFATKNDSILLDNNGALTHTGTFVGSSSLKDYYNVIDIASSDNILVILTQDNTVRVYTRNSNNYLEAESWNDIVDVACGDYFVAALDSHNRVHVDIENDTIKQDVNDWYDIVAIDAGSDYLIGFDGNKIYGVGNNSYRQFVKEEIIKQTLQKVSNVSYSIDDKYVYVQFDGVSNATKYSVSINVGVGLSQIVDSDDVVKFESESMTEGKTYTISIVALGGGNYKDSDVYSLDFRYEKPEDLVTIDETNYIGKTDVELKAYLETLGLQDINLVEKESEAVCDGSKKSIISTSIDGKTISKSELENTQIEYTYCRVLDEE